MLLSAADYSISVDNPKCKAFIIGAEIKVYCPKGEQTRLIVTSVDSLYSDTVILSNPNKMKRLRCAIGQKTEAIYYGIFIGEADARGRGVGTAAAKLMLRYCFEEEQLHRVYLRALSENGQAIRSYEKAGFRREGLLRDDVCIEGDYRDIVWMAAVNSGNDQENEE